MKLARMPDGSPEFFYTLQGEGRNIGAPSVFIRASLCNLHCVWCDTPYTWNWVDTDFSHESTEKFQRSEQIIDLSLSEIVEAVAAFGCHRFVFTGGEPLIQEKGWVELMGALDQELRGCFFEIETNGTLLPGEAFLKRISQLNVSPKLSNSNVQRDSRYFPDVLRSLSTTGKADFKFVVDDEISLNEVLSIVNECELRRENVFLMARARTVKELDDNQQFAATAAQENGFRYSDRLHLRLFGEKRGV